MKYIKLFENWKEHLNEALGNVIYKLVKELPNNKIILFKGANQARALIKHFEDLGYKVLNSHSNLLGTVVTRKLNMILKKNYTFHVKRQSCYAV